MFFLLTTFESTLLLRSILKISLLFTLYGKTNVIHKCTHYYKIRCLITRCIPLMRHLSDEQVPSLQVPYQAVRLPGQSC